MDINDLFEGIMKSINQFAAEIAEQRLQEKMQDTGRGPENGGKTRRPRMARGDSRRLVRQDAKPGRRSAMRSILRPKRSGI